MSDHSAWQQQAKTALQQLTPPGKPASNAQRFRDLLPDIEQRIADGVPQTDIVAALATAGLHMNIETFRNYLSAARRRLKKETKPDAKPATAPVVPAPKATPAALPLPAAPQQRSRPNAPAHLNWQAQRDNDKTF